MLDRNQLLSVIVISLFIGAVSGAVTTMVMNSGQDGEDNAFTLEAYYDGFVGVGGDIDGVTNPDLNVDANSKVTITLVAGEEMAHDFTIDAFGSSDKVSLTNVYEDEVTFEFTTGETALETYYCSIAGHFATMNGRLIIGDAAVQAPDTAMNLDQDVIKRPTDIPDPLGDRDPKNVSITLVTEEITAKLDDGTSFTFWTFNGTVPGPMLRVKVGDNVTINLMNNENSENTHSIDLHAANAEGGGAAYTQAAPGTTESFWFQPKWSGSFVYHCASPHVPSHISKGMFGSIIVEPEEGLPIVDKEFYVGQNEIYTKWDRGVEGHQEFDDQNQIDEDPQYVLFNGQVNALTNPAETSLNASIGQTVRLFFAVGGPNLQSNFHLIGGVWDRVWYETNSTEPNMVNAETVIVAPGSTLMIEMDLEATGRFLLVDHALSRTFDKGALGFLYVNE